MTKQEILGGYVNAHCPGLTGYAYQATTWCPDCGQAIARCRVREWARLPGKLDTITHDDLCDTDQFPVPIVFEPTDYCDNCGAIEESE